MKVDIQKNVDRFTGFAEIYDNVRPAMPTYPIETITRYLGKKPDRVIDLGCGTGLSTNAWKGYCQQVIGVEPSIDMLAVAHLKTTDHMSFIHRYAYDTRLKDDCADVVICSQSFHWMEPVTTLSEVNRLLKENGVFATVDCDWPPVAKWQAEAAYSKLYDKVKKIERELPVINDSYVMYDKGKHLNNIKESGYFRYAREISFANTEPCTIDRFIQIIFSQGSLQTIMKKAPGLLDDDLRDFEKEIKKIYEQDDHFNIDLSYRMRVAIK